MDGVTPRTVDDPVSQVEARLLRWLAQQPDRYTIDVVGQLTAGRNIEAVITNERTGRQGVWPAAWEVLSEPPLEELPLFRPRKVQGRLFG